MLRLKEPLLNARLSHREYSDKKTSDLRLLGERLKFAFSVRRRIPRYGPQLDRCGGATSYNRPPQIHCMRAKL
ncbi:hypothetical protein Poly59_43400 [Rubripirellula reticaptiva]|uniref:Uncharacterized protein n=1 Tax=Rubripirellula reticaptiva TaxID=2528013 RepID=A0A5C6EQ45_9BACT|nr:hypothetical protein Poly59_43400 [Rubripirellula reticaptiva]